MAEKSIDIKFNTKADITGAKQTAEALKEVQKAATESGTGAFDAYVKGAEKAEKAAQRLKEALGSITSTPDSDPFANAAKDTAREIDVLLQKQKELLAASREGMDIAGLDEATNKIKELCQAYDQLFNSQGQVADPSADVQAVIDAYDKRTAAAEKAFDRQEAAAAKALGKEIANNQKATDSANKYFDTYAAGQARIKMSLQQLYAEQERYNNKLKEAQANGDAAGIKDSVENLKRLETQINAVTKRAEVSDRRMATMVNRFRGMAGGAIQATSALSGMNGALGQTASLASSALQGAMFGGAYGAAFGVAVKGVELFISKLQEADKASEEFYKAQADKALAADKELREIYNKLGEQRQEQALKRYGDAIDDIKNKWNEASRATANHLSTLEEIADLKRQETDLMFAEGKVNLDRRLAEGTISQDQYDREMITLRTNSTLQQVDNERSERDLKRKGHYKRLQDATSQYDEANEYANQNNIDELISPTEFEKFATSDKLTSLNENNRSTKIEHLLNNTAQDWGIDYETLENVVREASSLEGNDFRDKMSHIIQPKGDAALWEKISPIANIWNRFVKSSHIDDMEEVSLLMQESNKYEDWKTKKESARKFGATDDDLANAEAYKKWHDAKKATSDEMKTQKETAWKIMTDENANLDKMDRTEPLFQSNAKRREKNAKGEDENANIRADKDYAIKSKDESIKAIQDEITRLKEVQKQAKLNNKPYGGQENAALETFKKNILADAQGAGLGANLPLDLFDEKGLMGQFIKDVAETVKQGVTVDEEHALGKKFKELRQAIRKQAGDGNRQKADGFLGNVEDETKNLLEITKSGGEEALVENQIAELERKVTQLEKENDDIKIGKNKSWLKPVKTPEAMKPKKAEKEITPLVEEVKAGVDGIKQAVESNSPEMEQITASFNSLGQTIITSNQGVSSAITTAVSSINSIKASFAALQAHADRMQHDIMKNNTNLMTFAGEVKRRISKI